MNGVSRFLSRKDKKKAPVKNELSKDIYHLFHIYDFWKKKTSKEEEKQIQDILKRLEALKITNLKESHVEYALRSASARGNADKAFDLLILFQETVSGQLMKSDPTVHMLGAENREMVTCYLDSLLFAMYARLDSFESILSVEFPDAATNALAKIIRFWVNMLRTGRLITTDITRHLQEALADCGWSDARRVAQQDVSEAFSFITDKLALPLLTLKMDVYHTGKEVNDDHRIVRERLLQVAIPENPEEGAEIRLEDCLESYFNNKVEVKRHLQRRNTINERPPMHAKPIIIEEAFVTGSKSKVSVESIFRHRRLDASSTSESSRVIRDDIDVHLGRKDSNRGLVFRKEVLMPAWQFFHLIPWFNLKSSADLGLTTDAQVATHFATKRPVLGICLKRYNVSPQGTARRVNTYIDIPLEIRLPHFISDGSEDDGFGSSFSKFQLSLKSIICHRGVSLDTGHYVSIVRPNNEEISKFPAGEGEIEPKYKWLLFDDLSKERVNHVDVRKALKDECPYLVFYQVQLIDEYAEYEDGLPPTYAEATNAPPSPNSKFTASEPTIGLPSNTSTSTIIGTSAFSTPALLSHVPSNADRPNSLAEGSRPDLDDDQSGTPQQHSILSIPPTNPNAIRRNQATTAPVSAQSSPVAHPEMNAPRPHSLDLSPLAMAVPLSGPRGGRGRSPSGRASQESSAADRLRGSLRGSVVLTDASSLATAPSAPVTPFDDALGISTGGGAAGGAGATAGRAAPEGYVSAKDGAAAAAATQLPQAQRASPGKRGRRRRRSKDKDGREKETRSSRYAGSARSWLPTRASPRPRSQPPPAEANRLSVAGMGGFVKGLREAMSRDSKGASAAAASSAAAAAAVDGEKGVVDVVDGASAAGNAAAAEEAPVAAVAAEGSTVALAPAAMPVAATDGAGGDGGSGTLKAKRGMGLHRRRSGKKGKAKKEASPRRVELEGPERQCVTM